MATMMYTSLLLITVVSIANNSVTGYFVGQVWQDGNNNYTVTALNDTHYAVIENGTTHGFNYSVGRFKRSSEDPSDANELQARMSLKRYSRLKDAISRIKEFEITGEVVGSFTNGTFLNKSAEIPLERFKRSSEVPSDASAPIELPAMKSGHSRQKRNDDGEDLGRPLTKVDFRNAARLEFEGNERTMTYALEHETSSDAHEYGEVYSEAVEQSATTEHGRKWPKSGNTFKIPYTISNKFTRGERATIAQGINEFHEKTCIRFVARSQENDFISIIKHKDKCFSTSIGKDPYGGKQELSIGLGCAYKGTVLHELMHAIGFFHEQSRPDRDDYVKILWDNMIDTTNIKYQFRKCGISSDEKCSNQDLRYDLDSLMHYTNGAFAKQVGLNTIEVKGNPGRRIAHSSRKNTFSDLDLKGILKMYDCNDKEPECGWMTPTNEENKLECGDGTSCDANTQGWGCCNGRSGRARCPKNHPIMCAEKKCAGGKDYCCNTTIPDCLKYGGQRTCDML